MDRIWNEQTTFETMKQQIGNLFQEKLGQGVLIGNVLELDREDYMLLYSRVDAVCNPGAFEQYLIILIAAWALAYRYGMEQRFMQDMGERMGKLQQHHTKYVLDMFESVFHDYRIDTFGVHFRMLEDVEKVIEKHHE